jgi:hypothetical protein
MIQKWEYGINQYPDTDTVGYVQDQLNLAGKNGWELIAVTQANGQITCFLKRALD